MSNYFRIYLMYLHVSESMSNKFKIQLDTRLFINYKKNAHLLPLPCRVLGN